MNSIVGVPSECVALVAWMSNADVAGARWQRMSAPYFLDLSEMAGEDGGVIEKFSSSE